jgi:hypothetical protein
MPNRSVHVNPNGNEWRVKTAGASRSARVTTNQAEAITIGRRIAINKAFELIVYRRDGSIRSRDSFGNGPFNNSPDPKSVS